MKLQTVVLLALLAISSATPALADCNYYSRLPSIDACTRESAKSAKAKQQGYPLSGIRRWCEQWQPQCAKAKRK
jgi:hypothetical protein